MQDREGRRPPPCEDDRLDEHQFKAAQSVRSQISRPTHDDLCEMAILADETAASALTGGFVRNPSSICKNGVQVQPKRQASLEW
jgi:hypothetical protein